MKHDPDPTPPQGRQDLAWERFSIEGTQKRKPVSPSWLIPSNPMSPRQSWITMTARPSGRCELRAPIRSILHGRCNLLVARSCRKGSTSDECLTISQNDLVGPYEDAEEHSSLESEIPHQDPRANLRRCYPKIGQSRPSLPHQPVGDARKRRSWHEHTAAPHR